MSRSGVTGAGSKDEEDAVFGLSSVVLRYVRETDAETPADMTWLS